MALGYVRPARAEDAEEIARVQHVTWQTAYPRFIPQFAVEHALATADVTSLAQQWRAAITNPPSSRHQVLVAIEQAEGVPEHMVGFVASGPADETTLDPDEPAPEPSTAAVTDLMVEPRWGRRGHGSRLLSAAVDAWRRHGFTRVLAWAFDKDDATTKFLTSTGWEPDGAARALDIEGVLAPQTRLHVSLEENPDDAGIPRDSG
ncbi:MAG: GNAT family N-acetyltransferase [Micromonosporaceae bacterium]